MLVLLSDFIPCFCEIACDPSEGDEVPTKIGDHVWSGIKSFSDKDESTVRKTLFIAARPDGLKSLAVFDSEFLEYQEIN